MRRQAGIGALLLVCVGVVLGATVFRSNIAQATGLKQSQSVIVDNTAANPVPVREQNLDGSGNVKVHEQGTANVNVTNGSLSIGLLPVTSGGGASLVTVGAPASIPISTASALSVAFGGGAAAVSLRYQGVEVGVVNGAVALGTGGPETVPVALTRPITFDQIVCFGIVGGTCTVDWFGNEP
jgi:hypothetical protein